jgi:hypothetical protein
VLCTIKGWKKYIIVTRVVERRASSNFACLLAKVYNVSYKSKFMLRFVIHKKRKKFGKMTYKSTFSIIQGFG